jgi:hypothetical protein
MWGDLLESYHLDKTENKIGGYLDRSWDIDCEYSRWMKITQVRVQRRALKLAVLDIETCASETIQRISLTESRVSLLHYGTSSVARNLDPFTLPART